MAKLISPWQRDDCLDPTHREALAVDGRGRTWRLHDTRPDFGGIAARRHPYDGRMSMVDGVGDLDALGPEFD